MADQHRHHEVNTAFTKSLRGSGLFKGARDWPETRISRSLINQYPDVYWRLVFTFFEAAINEQFPQAYVANVAAFLDCHGFVPAEYRQEDRQGGHPYRTQERPRLRQLLEQFLASNYYAANGGAERRPVFVPPPSPIWLLNEYRCIWPTNFTASCNATTPKGRQLFTVTFDRLHQLLVQDIADFANGTRNGDNKGLFQLVRVFRTRHAFYLTLFGMFRNEVELLRTLVTPVSDSVPARIVTAIQAHMQPTMQRLTNDLELRTRVYRAFIQLLVSCPKFVRANKDPKTNDALWEYLQIIGAYPREWAYWSLGDDYDHWNPGYHECAVLPTELANNREVTQFLARMSIIPPDATNGQLIHFLVDSMVEFAENRTVRDERRRGHDLREVDYLQDLQKDGTAPQGVYPNLDPIEVRNQIIWLSVIQFSLEDQNVPLAHQQYQEHGR